MALGRPRPGRRVTYLVAKRAVVVVADIPLLVQADGEVIGETPLEARVVPGATPVVVRPEGIPAPPV